jgi:hypothetical protein
VSADPPPDGGGPPPDGAIDRAFLLQSETSVARTVHEGTPRMIVGYNDATGLFTTTGAWRTDYTLMGWAISDDGGDSWTYQDPIEPSGDVPAWRGDPWIAAHGETVLFVNVVDEEGDGSGLSTTQLGIGVIASQDGGDSWGGPLLIAWEGADGPKIAIEPDAEEALVVFKVANVFRWQLLAEITGTPSLSSSGGVSPGSWGKGLPECPNEESPLYWTLDPHPVVAVGPSGTWYIAYIANYFQDALLSVSCGIRLDVIRSDNPAAGWARILSEDRPTGTAWEMIASSGTTRGQTRPALAVSTDGEGDVVLLAVPQYKPLSGSFTGEQRTRLLRLAGADTCDPDDDLHRCDPPAYSYPELSATLLFDIDGDQEPDEIPLSDDIGHFENQAALFTGDSVESRASDPRVGLFFYVQPWRGRNDGDTAYTTVFGLLSDDAGASWSPVRALPLPVAGAPAALTVDGGIVFRPCTTSSNYFGEYNGGAFADDSTDEFQAVMTWGDSRQGCLNQGGFEDTYHQHVFSGVMDWVPP